MPPAFEGDPLKMMLIIFKNIKKSLMALFYWRYLFFKLLRIFFSNLDTAT